MTQEEKDKAAEMLHTMWADQCLEIQMIEQRLDDYIQGLLFQPQYHNAYEILGAVKFLRLLSIL